MKKNKFALQIIVFVLIVMSFIACDKDFANLESDIINDDIATNFDIESDTWDVITYTKPLGPVQTNGLGLNTLGLYDDAYGRITSSFVVQPLLSSFAPTFGDDIKMDSVVLTIPYQFRVTEIDAEGNITYQVDSVIKREPLKLSLFESNYFIRSFDPNDEFDESQAYYSDKSASSTETILDAALEAEELNFVPNPDGDNHISLDTQGNLIINEDGYELLGPEPEDEEEQTRTIQPPGIRIKLDTTYWRNKIIEKEGQNVLSNANNFSEYFRGIYFKAEANDDNDGSFLFLNIGATSSNITIYYSRLSASTVDEADERENATFAIQLNGNSINFLNNDFSTPINEGDAVAGDNRIYLKGGEGAIGRIKLFDGFYDEEAGITNFEKFRTDFANIVDGEFVSSKRLVNEANLVFYVDQTMVTGNEPDRIFLYDVDNKSPLVDYFLDGVNNILPSISISNHLEPLQRVDDEPNGNGIKYKLRITEHINNLLTRDSTNVELGLAVSLNVNLEEAITQRKVKSATDSDLTVPISSVLSPRGTVLFGNNIPDNDADADKKVYLEIYYTEPND